MYILFIISGIASYIDTLLANVARVTSQKKKYLHHFFTFGLENAKLIPFLLCCFIEYLYPSQRFLVQTLSPNQKFQFILILSFRHCGFFLLLPPWNSIMTLCWGGMNISWNCMKPLQHLKGVKSLQYK